MEPASRLAALRSRANPTAITESSTANTAPYLFLASRRDTPMAARSGWRLRASGSLLTPLATASTSGSSWVVARSGQVLSGSASGWT